ncbi:MAG: hypothetical protein QXS69_00870 [Candidatus Aenigmatarchaeota archaeon]
MVDPISNLIITLNNLGFFKFIIPFILTSAVFYGLLRKSKIFGDPKENMAVNSVISISAAFLVSAAPIIAGIDITQYLSGFLIYTIFVMISIIVIMFLPFIFKPALEEVGKKQIDKTSFIFIFFLTLSVFIVIGLVVFRGFAFSISSMEEEVYSTIALIVFLLIFSIIIYFSLKPSK